MFTTRNCGRRAAVALLVGALMAQVLGATPALGYTDPITGASLPDNLIDVGPVSEFNGTPAAISDDDTIAFAGSPGGIWRKGTFTATPAVPGTAGYQTLLTMSTGGVAIGFAARTAQGGSHAFYWNTATDDGPQSYPAFPDEDAYADNCTTGGDSLDTIDAAGEAAGTVGTHNSTCNEVDFGITAASPGASYTAVTANAIHKIFAIQPNWALVQAYPNPGDPVHPWLTTPSGGGLTALPASTTTNVLTPDGGTVSRDGPNGGYHYLTAGGASTALQAPAGQTVSAITANNDSGELVGQSSNGDALLWTSPYSAPVDLNDDPGLPAGLHLGLPDGINAQGDIVGVAAAGDGNSYVYIYKAPTSTLSATIGLADGSGNPFTGSSSQIGQTLVATVDVTESDSADGAVTGLTVDPQGMTVAPSSSLTYVSNTAPPTSLTPGATASYTVTYHVAAKGVASLSVSPSGTLDGKQVSTTASTVAHLGQPLAVDVSWQDANGNPLVLKQAGKPDQPNTLRLADNDGGEVPQDVQAVVTITNVGTTKQQSVSINGIPALSYHTPSQATQSLPIAVTAGPLPPDPIGDLGPGGQATRTYTVHVTNNGVFDFSPQVLSSDDGSDTNVSQGVGTITALPTALLWLSLHRVGTGLIRPGTAVAVSGTLSDRSLTQAIDVDPLEPSALSGVGGGRLVDDDSTADLAASYLPDGVQLAFSGKVKPGQNITVTGTLDTTYVPATRGSVSYDPTGSVIGDDGKTETDLSPAQIGMSAGSSPITIGVDTTDPATPAVTADSVVDSFTDGVVQGTAAWSAAELRGAADFLAHPIDGSAAAVKGAASAVVHAPQDLADAAWILSSAEAYALLYEGLTPAEREQFAASIVSDFDQSSLKVDNAALSQQAQAGLSKFSNAVATGNYGALAKLAGSGLASGGGAVADAVLTDIFFQKLALGMNASVNTGKAYVRGQLANKMVLAEKLNAAKLAATVEQADKIPAGTNLLVNKASTLEKAWGLLPEQISKLRAFCKENNIIIAVRQRSARAAELIKKGYAIGKNEVLKIKGVNEIDVSYLNYRKHDLNMLVLAEPIPLKDVVANLKATGKWDDPYVRSIVLERYDVRVAEWESAKVKGVMDKANKAKEIDWGFNGTDNGAPGADKSGKRRFSLHDVKSEPVSKMPGTDHHRTYQEVYVGESAGKHAKLARVTQDVDVAAALSSNGEILSPAIRTKLYEYLSDVIGIEHPETASWINNGEILFQAKYKELKRLAPGGGEALAVFGPDGSARAGFLNPSLTIYDSATKGGRILFYGGYNSVYAKTISTVQVNLRSFF